jgi:hypothetical protein
MQGKLYLGLADEQRRTWIIAVDLKTKKWETLASSAATEGTSPFANMSPGPQFCAFFEDVERNRLLMFVNGLHPRVHKDKAKLSGLWSIDGKTQEFTHLSNYTLAGILPGHVLAGDTRILFGNQRGDTMLLDLNNVGSLQTTSVRTLGTLYDGYFWGVLTPSVYSGEEIWGRIAADGQSEREQLVFPELLKMGIPQSVFCRFTSDGKSLIVGDGFSLILLRFE